MPSLASAEHLQQGRAWHLSAVSAAGHPFQAWVRQSDGYPLRFAIAERDLRLVIEYFDFNRGVVIKAAPA